LIVGVSTGDATAFFDGAMLVEGESAFAFSPKPAEEGVWADYFATSTVVGWASFTKQNIFVKKIGKMVYVAYHLEGTSNSATTTFTLPWASTQALDWMARCIDNGGTSVPGYGSIAGAVVSQAKDLTGNAMTNSGQKTISAMFFYPIA